MVKQTYFLGGVSPEGFYSKFIEQIRQPGFYTYILKGGPGTGKSTLMKKTAEAFKEDSIDLYYCSSDTRSLDAVVNEDKRIIVVDGTAPHVFEALYPGASQEVINLGEFWDGKVLRANSDEVHRCFDENLKHHARVRCYVKALAALTGDITAVGENVLERKKLDAYISRLCKKVISENPGVNGRLSFRQISALTAEGYKTMPVSEDYTIYILKDDCLAGSDYFLREVSDYLVKNGHDATVSECCLSHRPIYEHVISESAGLAFLTSGFFSKPQYADAITVNFGRFYSKEVLSSKKQRLAFDRKAFCELAAEASDTLSEALAVHDELEKNYIDAIDFKRLNRFSNDFIKMITEV